MLDMYLDKTRLWRHLNAARDQHLTEFCVSIEEWEEFVTALSVTLNKQSLSSEPKNHARLYAAYLMHRGKFNRTEDLEAELDAAIDLP